MGFKKWISTTAAALLLATSVVVPTQAEEARTIADESIYDLLVDRYFNGTATNDFEVNAKNPADFAGGDFSGLVKKADHIAKMGYTIVSIGSIFETEKYDGSLPTTFTRFEDHFGTEEELKEVVAHYADKDMKIMVDFPLSNVSANHEWTQNAGWVAQATDGVAKFDLTNKEVQQALIDTVVNYVSTYGFEGVRLTNIEDASTQFINEVIAAIKAVDPMIYVIANSESDADFDAAFHSDYDRIFKDALKNVDLSTAALPTYVEETKPAQIMMDNLWSDRFTYDVMGPEGNEYPPNRLPLAVVTTLLMPGVAVTQYGTEIGMNGQAGVDSHQYFNFKTDEELIDKIEGVHTLRNASDTLRNGEFNVLQNEDDGFFVFERKSDEEHWIIVVNNTSITNRIDLTAEQLGESKELRGKIGEDEELVRANKEGNYPIIQDRETVEIYQVIDETGINVSYVVALALVYILFFAFIFIVIKRGRVRRAAQDTGLAPKE